MYSERFKLVEKSASGHCCFEYSILDKENPQTRVDGSAIVDEDGEPYYHIVCETYDKVYAEMILSVLNNMNRDIKLIDFN